jgi:hypothetical protein
VFSHHRLMAASAGKDKEIVGAPICGFKTRGIQRYGRGDHMDRFRHVLMTTLAAVSWSTPPRRNSSPSALFAL